MAVLKEWRGQGIGGFMLTPLDGACKGAGRSRSRPVRARSHAVPFYRAHGFVPRGGEYMEAGIRHQEMLRKL
jgi:predicted GNAT family N-acyltransferase